MKWSERARLTMMKKSWAQYADRLAAAERRPGHFAFYCDDIYAYEGFRWP